MFCYSYSIKKISIIFTIGIIAILFLYLFTIKKENFSQVPYKMDDTSQNPKVIDSKESFTNTIPTYPDQQTMIHSQPIEQFHYTRQSIQNPSNQVQYRQSIPTEQVQYRQSVPTDQVQYRQSIPIMEHVQTSRSFKPSKTTQSLFTPDGLLTPKKQYTSSVQLLQMNQDPYQRMNVSQPKESKNYYTPNLGTNARMYQEPVMIAPRIMDSQFSSVHTQFQSDEDPLQDFGGMSMDQPRSRRPNLLLQRRNTERELSETDLYDETTFMRDIQPHVYSTSNERLPITSNLGISSTPQLPTLSRKMVRGENGRLYPVYSRTNKQTDEDEEENEEDQTSPNSSSLKKKKKTKKKVKDKYEEDEEDDEDDDDDEKSNNNERTPIQFNVEINNNNPMLSKQMNKNSRYELSEDQEENEMMFSSDSKRTPIQFYSKKNRVNVPVDVQTNFDSYIDPDMYRERPSRVQGFQASRQGRVQGFQESRPTRQRMGNENLLLNNSQPRSFPSQRTSINSIRENRPEPQLPSASKKMFREKERLEQTLPSYSRNDPQLYRDDVPEERQEELPPRNKWSEEVPHAARGNPIYDIYDPRFTGYGDESRSYYDTDMGQIKYYYSDIDAYRSPNFIIRNKVDHVDFIDPMGKTWSEYPRTASLEDVKEQVNDDWLARSTEFREDIMEKLMRKNNSESWQLRFAPKSKGARLSTFTSGY